MKQGNKHKTTLVSETAACCGQAVSVPEHVADKPEKWSEWLRDLATDKALLLLDRRGKGKHQRHE